jgi:hypothetical protein
MGTTGIQTEMGTRKPTLLRTKAPILIAITIHGPHTLINCYVHNDFEFLELLMRYYGGRTDGKDIYYSAYLFVFIPC